MMLKDYRFTVRTHGATRRIVTMSAVAERRGLRIYDLSVLGAGHVSRSPMAQRVDRLRR
jgi:hypothetical protein